MWTTSQSYLNNQRQPQPTNQLFEPISASLSDIVMPSSADDMLHVLHVVVVSLSVSEEEQNVLALNKKPSYVEARNSK